MKCAHDLIPYFVGRQRAAAKEVTESFAMFYAAKQLLGEKVTEKGELDDCHVVVVGDGGMPRTGATFSYLTKATVDSIDPMLNMKKITDVAKMLGFETERLNCHKNKIENIKINCENKKTFLILPHSHAPFYSCINSLKSYTTLNIITMPCCVKLPEKFKKQCTRFVDDEVWSPKNEIFTKKNYE